MKRLLPILLILLPCYLLAGEGTLASQLLPIQQLVDSAVAHSATVRYYEGKIEQAHENVKIEKRQWGDYISAEAAYRVGIFDNISLNQTTGNDASTLTNQGQQTGYYIGARVSVPLSAAYSRNPKVRIAKIERDRAQAETEDRIRQVRYQVMELYADIQVTSAVLEMKMENLETSQLQMQQADLEFIQNKIGIQDIASYREILTKARVDVVKTESELQLAIDMLTDLCGCQPFIHPSIGTP